MAKIGYSSYCPKVIVIDGKKAYLKYQGNYIDIDYDGLSLRVEAPPADAVGPGASVGHKVGSLHLTTQHKEEDLERMIRKAILKSRVQKS